MRIKACITKTTYGTMLIDVPDEEIQKANECLNTRLYIHKAIENQLQNSPDIIWDEKGTEVKYIDWTTQI